MRIVFLKLFFLVLIFTLLSVYGQQKKDHQFKVVSVEFGGNEAFSDSRLRRLMVSRPRKFPSSLFASTHFYREVFKDDLANIKQFYHNQGYLQAAIADTQLSFNKEEKELSIDIAISEGELTRVEGISFFGNQVYSDSALLQQIKFGPGDPFKRRKINDTELDLLVRYANNGYLDTEIKTNVSINEEAHLAIIDFNITEKSQSIIGELKITGLVSVDTNVVLRELLFEEGEVVNYSELLKSQRRLYLTALFESVFIRPQTPENVDPGKKDILIELKEKQYGEFNVSAGYGSVEKVKGQIEIFHTSLAGTARKTGISTHLSFITRNLEATFTEPWTFGLPYTTDMKAFLNYREEPSFTLNSRGASVTIGRDFGERSTVSLTYKFEDVDLSDIKITDIPIEEKNDLRTLSLSLIYDTRDNIFDTEKGTFIEWRNEIAGSFLSGTNTFVRSIVIFKYFFPWSRSTVLGTSLAFGWMDRFGSQPQIPLSEKFRAGGPNVLRGFDFQEVGPLDSKGNPLGGNLKFTWNVLEIRQAIYKWIGGAAFLDMGNVWSDADEFRLKDIRTSPGIGIRVSTPIGLARLDYGVNISPRSGEPGGQIYFSMGQAF